MFSRRMAFLLLVAAGCTDNSNMQMQNPMCNTGQRLCSGVCVDVMTDPINCGQCGKPCDQGQVCAGGLCAQQCPVGLTQCDRSCLDTKTDHAHCGDCMTQCKDDEVCSMGKCSVSCPMGLTNCNGVCVDLMTDAAHCSACDKACPPQNKCDAGSCVIDCQLPLLTCGDMCVDPRWDPDNCGACGKACVPPANKARYCQMSACLVGDCLPGFKDCNGDPMDGCEADLNSDPMNCGDCFNSCPQPPHLSYRCAMAMCEQGSCDAGFADCDGVPFDGCEVDLNGDVNNCGQCGNVCVAPPNVEVTCDMGVCKLGACVQGFTDCNNNMQDGCEADTTSDVNNCGACGNVCPMNTPFCIKGMCTSAQIFTAMFTNGQGGDASCQPWNMYRMSLGNSYNAVTLSGTNDMVGFTCTNSGANEPGQIAQALRNGQAFSIACGGHTWSVGTCGAGIELSATGFICQCQNPGYTIRPCINPGNPNWGGVKTSTCFAPSQTITVTFN